MKPVRILLICYLFSGLPLQGQTPYQLRSDTLQRAWRQGDMEKAFQQIQPMAILAGKAGDWKALDSLARLYKENFHHGGLNPKTIRRVGMHLGRIFEISRGDFQEALRIYLIAHQHTDDKNLPDAYAWFVENPIGSIYTRLGDYEKARLFYALTERSLLSYMQSDSQSTQMVERYIRFCTNEGRRYYSTGDTIGALTYWMRGYTMADSLRLSEGRHANAMALTELYIEQKKFEKAASYLEISDSTYSQLPRKSNLIERKANLLHVKGNYCLSKGKALGEDSLIESSITWFLTALDTLSAYYQHRHRREYAKWITPLVEAYWLTGQYGLAQRALHEAFACLIADYQFGTLPEYDQLYHENTFIELFRWQSRLYRTSYEQDSDPGWLMEALECLERAIFINDIILEQVVSDPSKLTAIRDNTSLIQEALDILFHLYQTDTTPTITSRVRSFFTKSKSRLLDEKRKGRMIASRLTGKDSIDLADLQVRIRETHALKFTPGIDLDSLRGVLLDLEEQKSKRLDAHDSLISRNALQGDYIEYTVSGNDIYILSDIGGKQHFVRSGSVQELNQLLNRMNEYLLLRDLGEDTTILQDLYAFLVVPVLDTIPPRLVVIPDGEVSYIPFDLMVMPDGEWLIRRTTISYAHSYETIPSPSSGDFGLLSWIGLAPTYPAKPEKDKQTHRGTLYHLPYARMEVDTIASLFHRKATVLEYVRKKDLWESIPRTSVFHFSGHAIVDGDASWLALDGEDKDDRRLTAEEISLMDGSARLVVLSACETGLGNMERGEGIRSLGRSFMEAGATTAVISLWNVNDRSTSIMMTDFYKFLLEGFFVDEALRKAKLRYISSADKHLPHPYYWAGFVPVGETRMKIEFFPD